MRFAKLMLLFSGVLMSASLVAQEVDKPIQTIKKDSSTTYIGYELGSQGVYHPSIGHRRQYDSYIFDVNGGYKYIVTMAGHLQTAKVGINAYKSFHPSKEGQIYFGIGVDFVGIKIKRHSRFLKWDYALHPSISIGHDFMIGSDKIVFCELSYKPYAFGRYAKLFIHSIGCRVGIGF